MSRLPVRRLTAILICWILILAQGFAVLGRDLPKAPKPCCCCDCGGAGCCVSEDTSPMSQAETALPAVAGGHASWIIAILQAAKPLSAPIPTGSRSCPDHTVAFPNAVAVYLQNCALLI